MSAVNTPSIALAGDQTPIVEGRLIPDADEEFARGCTRFEACHRDSAIKMLQASH